MRYAVLFLVTALLGLTTSPICAQDASPAATPPTPAMAASTTAPVAAKSFSDSDKAAIEDIIKTYLTKEHPEVLMEAMQELQKRDQVSAEAKSKTAIAGAKDKIFDDPNSPVGGNPKGSVTMVEFFDYQCGYCKMSEEAVERLLKEDKDVKYIYKEFPILGPMSVEATKAALAAARQGNAKYIKLHDILMAKKDHLNDDLIFAAAKDAGLDLDKLKKDMNDDIITKIIQANIDLGGQIGVRGTPMFIIGEQIYPGAMQYDQLKKAVDDERAKKK